MAQNYTVNYTINVHEKTAVTAIQNFQRATQALTQITGTFRKVSQAVNGMSNNLTKLAAKTYTVKVETGKATNHINKLIGRVSVLKRELASLKAMGVNLGGTPSKGRTTPISSRSKSQGALMSRNNVITRNMPRNLGYKAIGPTPLDVGGIGAINMLKGMGIAYGLAGIGTLVSNIVRDAVAYDNSMQTVKNILSSHDKRNNFSGRFKGMEQIVRNVGVETKFTAPEVADAAKFLAMAGFKIEDINAAIRPIADIALIGDTELGETADVVTNIMTGYGINPDNVRKAADIMTNTFTMSNTTLMEMAEAYKYSASLLSAGGIDFEESTAALGILGNAGIKGSQAGTTMRTIMANIVNPTKKQRAAWDAIGVKRTNENGQVRDLTDIFGDLASKNLEVADFYRLFHKTAAQGAVSLANHVEEWNNIIKENFLSEGMSKDLAEAKKNTIQGLWAQLTSAFTENGLKAFEGVQTPIRSLLQGAIDWLKTEEAANSIRTFANDILEFVGKIKDATIWIVKLMSIFKPFIKMWLTFQIYMWPVLTGIRVFKAALLGFGVLVKVGGWLAMVTGKMKAFGAATKAAAASGKGMSGLWAFAKNNINSGINNVGSYFQGQYLKGVVGRDVSPAVWDRYQRIYGKGKYSKGASPTPPAGGGGGLRTFGVGSALKGAGGAIGGALAGSAIGEAVGGDTGSWIGGLAGGILMPALLSAGPWGWAAAGVIALGGLAAAWWNASAAADRAADAAAAFNSSLSMENGVLVGEGLSKTEEYLNLIYNKNLDINDVISKRIELLKEEAGLQDKGKVTANENTINMKVFNKALSTYDNTDHWYDSSSMAQYAAEGANAFGSRKAFLSAGGWVWYDRDGASHFLPNPDGANDEQDVLAAMSVLYREGISGSQASLAKAEFANRMKYILAHNGNLEDILSVRDDWNNRFGGWTYDTDKGIEGFNYGLGDIKNWSSDEISRSYAYNQGLYDSMVGVYGANAPIWTAAQNYWQGIEGNNIQIGTVVEYIRQMNEVLGGLFATTDTLTLNDPEAFNNWLIEWQKSLGYWDGTFHALNGNDAATVAETTRIQLDTLIKTLSGLDLPAQSATANLLNFSYQLRGLAAGFTFQANGGQAPAVGAAADGAIRTVNGMRYKYRKGSNDWQMVDTKGNDIVVALPISDAQFQNMAASDGGNQTGGGGTGTGVGGRGGGSGYNGHDQSNYKSHYNNNNATPKQVILNIKSLLDVHSINLTKGDNAAVIETVKDQVIATLVEAASEGINQINHMA